MRRNDKATGNNHTISPVHQTFHMYCRHTYMHAGTHDMYMYNDMYTPAQTPSSAHTF